MAYPVNAAHKATRLILAALFLISAAPAAAENPEALTRDAVVQSIENHYRELVDLSAKVAQKNTLKSIGRTQKFEGSLLIKKPGRLRLEYTNGQTIVIDGKDAWFYSKKSEQAIRRAFTDFENANIPVAFLLGAAAIQADFEVAQPQPDKPRMLELIPKKPGAAMKKLRILSDEAGRIIELTIFDKSGNTTEIIFTEIKEGIGAEDKLFKFKVPKGTEVIEQ